MEIFIDSANKNEIKKWIDCSVADGVTTNPSIMFKDGVLDIERGSKELADLIYPRPLSVEVTSNDPKEMLEQAMAISKWAKNIVIKIPIINADGVPCTNVIKQLEEEGIKVNATLILSFGQFILAVKSNATYASVFAGRVEDEGHDSAVLVSQACEFLSHWPKYKTKIIVASIRGIRDIQESAVSGAHILTIPPALINKMADHRNTRFGVRTFIDDTAKAMEAAKKKP
ncbi:MAG: transaldolase family protein [bacterium]